MSKDIIDMKKLMADIEDSDPEKETFSRGDIIWIHSRDNHYLIVSITPNQVKFIRLDDYSEYAGFWFNGSANVKDDENITKEELSKSFSNYILNQRDTPPHDLDFGKVGRYEDLVK